MERGFDQSLIYSVRIDDHTRTRPASILNNNLKVSMIFLQIV